MSKNETGEFELVLGNKQLLSVFFIVVILLAVFFTMGFIVGRNSSPPQLEATNRKQDRSPLVVDSPNAPPPTQIPSAATPMVEDKKKPEPVVETKAPEKAPEKAKEPEKPKEKEKKEPPPPPPPPADDNGGGAPAKGTHYLQVQALPTEQSALVMKVMRQKGFSVAAESVPGKPLTRILVGPVTPAAAGEMRDKLDAAGFKGKQAILRKF